MRYHFSAKVWIYPGHAAWHFVNVPKVESAKISKKYVGQSRGWGSLPVAVTVGKTRWKTSIFPDKRSGTFLLPIKKDVRKEEGIMYDDIVDIRLTINVT